MSQLQTGQREETRLRVMLADDDEVRFDERMKKLVKQEPVEKPE